MGGAIAVHVAVQKLLPSLAGLAVIDVVEGKEHYKPFWWKHNNKTGVHCTLSHANQHFVYWYPFQVQQWKHCLPCSHFSGVDHLHFNHWSKVLNGGKYWHLDTETYSCPLLEQWLVNKKNIIRTRQSACVWCHLCCMVTLFSQTMVT